jgi:hypothetical protein
MTKHQISLSLIARKLSTLADTWASGHLKRDSIWSNSRLQRESIFTKHDNYSNDVTALPRTSRSNILIYLAFCSLLVGCENRSYSIGNCLIPQGKTSLTSIIRLVSISSDKYIFFTHFLSNGKLVLAENYQKANAIDIKTKYVLIE